MISTIDLYQALPVLETERLRLRPVRIEDATDIYAYTKDEETARYVSWYAHETLADSEKFVEYILRQYEQGNPAPWAIEDKASGKVIGTIDFIKVSFEQHQAELGYALSRDNWGKGLMPEAAARLVQYGFETLGLERIQARCFVANDGSARVMEKIGMTFEGVSRSALYVKERFWDLKIYAITRSDYEGR